MDVLAFLKYGFAGQFKTCQDVYASRIREAVSVQLH